MKYQKVVLEDYLALKIMEVALCVCGLVALFWLPFEFASIAFHKVAALIVTSLLFLGTLFGVLWGAWRHYRFRHTMAILSLILCALFGLIAYLSRTRVSYDTSTYLQGNSQFIECAAQVLPEAEALSEAADVAYKHVDEGLFEGEYIELILTYDSDTYADAAARWAAEYPVLTYPSWNLTPPATEFQFGQTQYRVVDLEQVTGTPEPWPYDLFVGFNEETCQISMLFNDDDDSLGRDQIIQLWHEGAHY